MTEIEQLTNDCLIYLSDQDIKININTLTGYYLIRLVGDKDWLDIKDDYLFYIDVLLNNGYKFVGRNPFTIKQCYNSRVHCNYDELRKIKDVESAKYNNKSIDISLFIGKL